MHRVSRSPNIRINKHVLIRVFCSISHQYLPPAVHVHQCPWCVLWGRPGHLPPGDGQKPAGQHRTLADGTSTWWCTNNVYVVTKSWGCFHEDKFGCTKLLYNVPWQVLSTFYEFWVNFLKKTKKTLLTEPATTELLILQRKMFVNNLWTIYCENGKECSNIKKHFQ